MLPGARRGPKPSKWKSTASNSFTAHFARRSSPLNPAEADEEPPLDIQIGGDDSSQWLFTGLGGEEPEQVQIVLGGRTKNVALGLTGATNSKGKGVASESIVVTIMQTLDDGEVLMLRRPAPLTQAELEDFERSEALITSSQLRRLQPVHKVKRTRKAQPVRA